MIRICLIEDHPATRQSLVKLLRHAADIVCLGAFMNSEQAETEIPGLKPDVVLVDINLPGRGGIECVAALKSAHPEIEFVMLTTYEDTELIFNALRAGASGYLLKRSAPDELLAAITQVHQGGAPMSLGIARRVVMEFRGPYRPAQPDVEALSKREREILDQLTAGLSDKQIAAALGISANTVHNHLRRIYDKLHVQSRTEAVVRALGR